VLQIWPKKEKLSNGAKKGGRNERGKKMKEEKNERTMKETVKNTKINKTNLYITLSFHCIYNEQIFLFSRLYKSLRSPKFRQ